jgi:GNAT superfamily N-acetyltransferase
MFASDLSLAQRLEHDAGRHLIEYVHGLNTNPETGLEDRPEKASEREARKIADGVMVRTGSLGINVAIGLGLHGPVTNTDLDELEQFFVTAGRTPRIELCPLADPNLIAQLADRQFRPQRFVQTLMRPIDAEEPFETTPGIEIIPIDATLEEAWIHAFTSGFGTRNTSEHSEIDSKLAQIALRRPGSNCFVARQHGELIGTGALAVREDHEGWRIGSLYLASTAAHARGRGVQHALVQARLQAARNAGCDAVTTQAKPGATTGLERQGFGVMYTKVVLEQLQAGLRAVTLEFE